MAGELETIRLHSGSGQAELDSARSELEAARAEIEDTRSELESARSEVDATRTELESARAEVDATRTGADATRAEVDATRAELEAARTELEAAQAEIQTELTRSVEVARRAEQAEEELTMLRQQQMAASAQGTDELAEIARVAQERLAAQSEKLAEMEDRARTAERQMQDALARLEDAEGDLLRAGMIEGASGAEGDAAMLDDRRGTTPFTKELSLDAKKTLTQILGITLTLKHKKSPQDQAPFLRQLSAMAKRLDRTVSDLAEADKLARGLIELNIRRTNLEALVERVVEESGVGGDHEVRVETEELVVGVDPLRTEQILNGLLRNSADRTSPGSEMTVRLQHLEEGALLSVEDKETSSDGSLSPVVARLADVMGGWARVESRPNGGSAFRVYLPDQSGGGVRTAPSSTEDGTTAEDRLQITVENPQAETAEEAELAAAEDAARAAEDDPWAAGQLLVQELQRLSNQERR
ncbi:MAG: hypothetical protein HY240_01675 [Actinobacteria bacterium]|nr:hypothetical protein [Actinomycetota bacterium]